MVIKIGKTEWKYKSYHIYLESYSPRKYRIVSYANDFKPKIVRTLPQARKFIDKILGVDN